MNICFERISILFRCGGEPVNMFRYDNCGNMCGGGYCEPMGSSKEYKIAVLDEQERILERKLEMIRKLKEALKSKSEEKKEAVK
jgi:hypothetical protein